jgi:hypothetical protein
MSLTFRCPECREFVHVCPSLAGLHTHCPSCQVSVPVPDTDRPPNEDEARRLSAKKRWQAVTNPGEVASPALFDPWPWVMLSLVLLFIGGVVWLMFLSRPGE